MNLIIDYREHRLVEHFRDRSNVTIKKLDIGDVIFRFKDELVILIERKTVNDLVSSIMDGRNREQKMRIMNSDIDNSKVLYLIEGDVNNVYCKKMNSKTVIGSIVNTLIRDNLKVYRTDNIEDTIKFIERIYDKLDKKPENLVRENDTLPTVNIGINYANTIKKKKKANLTTEICSIIQLSQIPGVSTNMSKVIIDEYGSIYNLCKKYAEYETNENNDAICGDILKELIMPISNSKTRKIGPKASVKIYNYLLNKN